MKLPLNPRLSAALAVIALVGFAMLIAGSVKNYGPLYTFGGVWIGFAFGIQLYRSTVQREAARLLDTNDSSEVDDVGGRSTGRQAPKDVRPEDGRFGG